METKIKPGVAALGFKDTYMKFRDSSHIAVRLPFPIHFSIWAIVPGLAVRPGTCYVVPSDTSRLHWKHHPDVRTIHHSFVFFVGYHELH